MVNEYKLKERESLFKELSLQKIISRCLSQWKTGVIELKRYIQRLFINFVQLHALKYQMSFDVNLDLGFSKD